MWCPKFKNINIAAWHFPTLPQVSKNRPPPEHVGDFKFLVSSKLSPFCGKGHVSLTRLKSPGKVSLSNLVLQQLKCNFFWWGTNLLLGPVKMLGSSVYITTAIPPISGCASEPGDAHHNPPCHCPACQSIRWLRWRYSSTEGHGRKGATSLFVNFGYKKNGQKGIYSAMYCWFKVGLHKYCKVFHCFIKVYRSYKLYIIVAQHLLVQISSNEFYSPLFWIDCLESFRQRMETFQGQVNIGSYSKHQAIEK